MSPGVAFDKFEELPFVISEMLPSVVLTVSFTVPSLFSPEENGHHPA
jgi:hypothetical protein